MVVTCDSILGIHPSYVYYLIIEPCLYPDNKQNKFKRHTDNVPPFFYKIPECPGANFNIEFMSLVLNMIYVFYVTKLAHYTV